MPNPNLLSINNVQGQTLASRQVDVGDTAVYTAGASTTTRLATMSACNVSGSPVNVAVSLLRKGQTVDGTHRVAVFTLNAGDSTKITELEGAWVGAEGFVNVNVSAGVAIDIVLTGIEISA